MCIARPHVLPRLLPAIVLAGTLVSSMTPLTIQAQEPRVVVDDVEVGKSGATITVRLVNFEDLAGVTFALTYDTSLVTVASASNGTLDAGGYACEAPVIANGMVIQTWASATGVIGTFVLFTVTFKPVAAGTFDFGYGTSAFINSDLNELAWSPSMGTASICPDVESQGDSQTQHTNPAEEREDYEAEIEGSTPPTPAPSGDPEIAKDEPAWSVSPLTVSPNQLLPGQEVTISANICNSGEEQLFRTVSLMIDGSAEQSQSVGVSGGSCQQVVFKTSRTVPGTYQVAIDGMTGEFSVLAPRTVTRDVPSQQQTGLGTAGIIAIIAVIVVLIAALIIAFRRA